MISDALIVGSGPSGVHAAYPLVLGGRQVTLLDVGHEDRTYAPLIPKGPFVEIRQTDPQQCRYMLGERFEGVSFGAVRPGAQLTPPRQYVVRDTQELTPVESSSFFPLESLALGGLAGAWGAGVFPYTERDLEGFPFTAQELERHYHVVAERIGVSGARDDLLPYYGECPSLLPPLNEDWNASLILAAYRRRRATLNAAGLFLGYPRLAALSRAHRGRGPDRYLDMSFWADSDRSVYRPRYSLEELQRHPNFAYHRPVLVSAFREQRGVVTVSGRNLATGRTERHRARSLVLTAGVFGTTRIVLRSLGRYGQKVPLLANPYTLVPMINLAMLGRVPGPDRHSLAQLCLVLDSPDRREPLVHAHVHTYRSLLNFRLIQEMPLAYREGMRVAKLLVPALAILAIDHEDRPDPGKYCRLHRGEAGAPDRLELVYSPPETAVHRQRRQERRLLRLFLRMGCLPLKPTRPGHAASAHYGGTFPMTREEKDLTVTPEGRLRGTEAVYLADGSVFPYLPAKALTFTMMANANRIGEHLAAVLR